MKNRRRMPADRDICRLAGNLFAPVGWMPFQTHRECDWCGGGVETQYSTVP